ncbi:hypothetical protein KJ848_00980 [Patescibacteria group bacterium]|nr:hypothetical protein [Patescibacteria group bacterium]MBU2158740.1 hypothetical protein [Patescibacteria group bacterium]
MTDVASEDLMVHIQCALQEIDLDRVPAPPKLPAESRYTRVGGAVSDRLRRLFTYRNEVSKEQVHLDKVARAQAAALYGPDFSMSTCTAERVLELLKETTRIMRPLEDNSRLLGVLDMFLCEQAIREFPDIYERVSNGFILNENWEIVWTLDSAGEAIFVEVTPYGLRRSSSMMSRIIGAALNSQQEQPPGSTTH